MTDDTQYWLLLEKSDRTRISSGIDGYDDVTGHKYLYDNLVPNYTKLKPGDTAVIRIEDEIDGFATIEKIETYPDVKTHRRCPIPECRSTDIRERKKIEPKWKCGKCGTEFDNYVETTKDVQVYVAEYSNYQVITDKPTVSSVKSCGLGDKSVKSQLSMMQLDEDKLTALIPEIGSSDILESPPPAESQTDTPVKENAPTKTLEQQLAELAKEQENEGEFDAGNDIDAREKVLREINKRRGQPKFRKSLLLAYGEQCAVTGFETPAALEAAHIRAYRGEHTNHVQNGLLLRSDIHTLFDCGLLAVNTKTMTIVLSNELSESKYKVFDGRYLKLPMDKSQHPSKDALDQHRLDAGL